MLRDLIKIKVHIIRIGIESALLSCVGIRTRHAASGALTCLWRWRRRWCSMSKESTCGIKQSGYRVRTGWKVGCSISSSMMMTVTSLLIFFGTINDFTTTMIISIHAKWQYQWDTYQTGQVPLILSHGLIQSGWKTWAHSSSITWSSGAYSSLQTAQSSLSAILIYQSRWHASWFTYLPTSFWFNFRIGKDSMTLAGAGGGALLFAMIRHQSIIPIHANFLTHYSDSSIASWFDPKHPGRKHSRPNC